MSSQEQENNSYQSDEQEDSSEQSAQSDTDSSKVHIEPSESDDGESETGNQTGDPGRTPGKAEG